MSACSSAVLNPQLSDSDPSKIYKYDFSGSVNGISFDGVGVIPAANKYTLDVESKVDVDLLTISSCHRNFSAESVINTPGWFQKRRGYSYEYDPAPGIEDVGSCLVRVGSYNKSQGQDGWGVIDFETSDATLPADNQCDGILTHSNGVSICQSLFGLKQVLTFPVPVKLAANAQCQIDSPQDGKTWVYAIPRGECVMAFQELQPPYRLHRHTTIGYTDILIRGN